MRPKIELAEIVRAYGDGFIKTCNPLKYHRRVLSAISKCRTSALGGHVERCEGCAHERIAYNSCRNRHCPKCQRSNTDRWIEARNGDLIDCQYFHCVFTIPQALNVFCLHYPDKLYDILFQTSKETIERFGRDAKHLGAQMGSISVLHTWGQNLTLHPHVHMIIPGGGIDNRGQWMSCRGNGKYLFPVKAMSQVFRGKFMSSFTDFMESSGMYVTSELKRDLYAKDWVVYAKRPFGGASQVIEYLGRYTHKIAISNHRIKSMDGDKISFTYKDYRHESKTKLMTLDADEFLRRFCLHILPRGYRKIRHYGILSSRNKHLLKDLKQSEIPQTMTQEIAMAIPAIQPTKVHPWQKCPCCEKGTMVRIRAFNANAPPLIHQNRISITL